MTLDIGIAARTIAGIRSTTALHHGCLGWDTPGIVKALEAVGYSGAAVAAACLAAEDPKLDKPSAAGFRAHWPVNATSTPRVSYDQECPDHPDQAAGTCPRCRDARLAAHTSPEVEAARAEVWRVIREGRSSRPHKNEPRPRTDAETIAQARAQTDQETTS